MQKLTSIVINIARKDNISGFNVQSKIEEWKPTNWKISVFL